MTIEAKYRRELKKQKGWSGGDVISIMTHLDFLLWYYAGGRL